MRFKSSTKGYARIDYFKIVSAVDISFTLSILYREADVW